MTDKKGIKMTNTNEPAYPIKGALVEHQYSGLSKREIFAMTAMQGLISIRATCPIGLKKVVEESLIYADALLEELSKVKNND